MATSGQLRTTSEQLLTVVMRSLTWPSGFKPEEVAAGELGIDVNRLVTLADGGFAPHIRVDGGPPMFKMSELKQWAAANLLQRVAGKSLPDPVRIVVPAAPV
jgi:hypothetical protein